MWNKITEANEEEGITGNDAVFCEGVNVMHGYTELVLD